MKRKYREAMRAAARLVLEPDDDDDEDAAEVMGWHEEWAMHAAPEQQDETNNYRSHE